MSESVPETGSDAVPVPGLAPLGVRSCLLAGSGVAIGLESNGSLPGSETFALWPLLEKLAVSLALSVQRFSVHSQSY